MEELIPSVCPYFSLRAQELRCCQGTATATTGGAELHLHSPKAGQHKHKRKQHCNSQQVVDNIFAFIVNLSISVGLQLDRRYFSWILGLPVTHSVYLQKNMALKGGRVMAF